MNNMARERLPKSVLLEALTNNISVRKEMLEYGDMSVVEELKRDLEKMDVLIDEGFEDYFPKKVLASKPVTA